MKILLILPYDTTYKYKTAFIPAISYQPLTLGTLAALVPDELNAQITLVDEGVQRIEPFKKQHYDLVGISAVTSSSIRAYELARYFRENGSYVFIGGHHATLLPDEAARHCDTVFTGSAQSTMPQFFYDYVQGQAQPRYDSHIVIASEIPTARRELMPKRGYLKQPTIVADYGCANNCKYCVINPFWGANTRRPIADVIDEIKSLGRKEYIFLDPSPLSNIAYAKELYSELAKLDISWVGLSTLDVANDDELLDLLQKSGCIGLLLGFETFSQPDLDMLSKTKNKVIEYSTVVSKLHDKNIAVLGTFMLGLESDTRESLAALPELIAKTKIDIPRYAILTPYPTTALFDELDLQGRILTKDWSKYDSIHCVFKPANMSAGELEEASVRVWKETYSLKKIAARMKHTPQRKLTALITNVGFAIYTSRLRGLL